MERRDEVPGPGRGDGALSRRRFFAASGGLGAAALGATGCRAGGGGAYAPSSVIAEGSSGALRAPAASGVLAANVNEALEKIDFAELRAVAATWVRGFYPMPDADHGDPAGQPGLARLLQAAARGYGTVLTLKFPYQDRPIPAPGTPAMATAVARLHKILAATMGKVDILTIGNEPFIETREADRRTPAINVFYETLARHAIRYRSAHGDTHHATAIYMGALTGLDRPDADTAQTRRWVTYVARDRDIAGVDIHPHVASPDEARRFVAYVLPYLRSDQRFLATEFSLVHLWKQHNTDPLPADFARRHHLPATTPVWRYIRDAAAHPVSEQEWNDFVLACPWFSAHKTFLTDQIARFRATGKLAVAAYGLLQAGPIPHFGPKSAPWVINSIYPQYVTRRTSTGLPARNRTWANAFQAAQRR